METVTMEMVYRELKSIKRQLAVVEHATIPTVRLSRGELAAHRKDLKEALESPGVRYK